ncbi:MAG: hypothetical protein AABY51_06010 [Deltaproteobacteria bacterium]
MTIFHLMHIVHLVTVVLWIGGLAFVTAFILPMVIKMPDALSKVLLFQRVEHRFAPVAKVFNIITGATGFVMVFVMGWQSLYFTKAGIALTFMTAVWLLWFIMLVGLEPIVIKKMLDRMARDGAKMDIDGIFRKVNKLHWMLLMLSILAIIAGSIVAHGPFFI